VDYTSGLVVHSEWVCLEHAGYPRQKAADWWRQRAPGIPFPSSVQDALASVHRFRRPAHIAVQPSGRFVEIVGARF